MEIIQLTFKGQIKITELVKNAIICLILCSRYEYQSSLVLLIILLLSIKCLNYSITVPYAVKSIEESRQSLVNEASV